MLDMLRDHDAMNNCFISLISFHIDYYYLFIYFYFSNHRKHADIFPKCILFYELISFTIRNERKNKMVNTKNWKPKMNLKSPLWFIWYYISLVVYFFSLNKSQEENSKWKILKVLFCMIDNLLDVCDHLPTSLLSKSYCNKKQYYCIAYAVNMKQNT